MMKLLRTIFVAALGGGVFAAQAQGAATMLATGAVLVAKTQAQTIVAAAEFKAVDADGHTVVLNRPGRVTVVIGTNADSQDGARAAGRAMYPFEGIRAFRLIVVADVRDSMATWVPSLVLSRMRVSLDHEAFELKPYFLKNGNPDDPRPSLSSIADFDGSICPQLGWAKPTSNLRGILFGPDGREITRWENLTDMEALQAAVKKALQGAK